MSVLRASLLGGVDGVITSFVVVAGVHAGSLATRVAVVVGLSSVLADGLSMGVSEFLSSDAERSSATTSTTTAAAGAHPLKLGLACFLSFVGCGLLPVLLYAAVESLLATAALAMLELLLLGAARGVVTRERTLTWPAVQTATLGGLASAVAYAVAAGVK